MSIIGALDVHRRQISFEYADSESGQLRVGRLNGPHRTRLREWVAREFTNRDDVALALEGCTGWRYVAEELAAGGVEVHLADPAEVQTRRGKKRRAKTDRSDCRLMRELLERNELPESWIPPAHVLEARSLARLYKALLEERTAWMQRMQATVFHHGLPEVGALGHPDTRAMLTNSAAGLSPTGQRVIAVGYRQMDALGAELVELRAEFATLCEANVAPRRLRADFFGVGPLLGVIIWAELGDCRRFANSDQAVRHAGLDVSVYASDSRRAPGHLTRQGPPLLRWGLYEAAKSAARPTSPDHDYYREVKERLDGTRAALAVARKLARRAHHSLRAMGDEAWAPPQ